VTVNISRTDEVERFTREISLIGNLDADQTVRLLDIADKCPVHKALIGTIEIDTQLMP
jgi:putative redox protein